MPATCCGVRPGFGFPNSFARHAKYSIAGALDEDRARDLWKSFQVGEREERRPIYKSVNEKTVTGGIDERNARVVDLEVQVGRRDRTGEILERCKRAAGHRARGRTRRLDRRCT
jgi:hypothetical protein